MTYQLPTVTYQHQFALVASFATFAVVASEAIAFASKTVLPTIHLAISHLYLFDPNRDLDLFDPIAISHQFVSK